LPNTSLLYYGRTSSVEVSSSEQSYIDFVANGVFAGFGSITGMDEYSKFAIKRGKIMFNDGDDVLSASNTRIPGYFTMLGGPSSGPNALVKIIKHYSWERVVLYYQNAPSETAQVETFSSLAEAEGITFELQKRESAGTSAAEVDVNTLLNAKSNIFVFFGGFPDFHSAHMSDPWDMGRSCVHNSMAHVMALFQVTDVSTTWQGRWLHLGLRSRSFAAVCHACVLCLLEPPVTGPCLCLDPRDVASVH
jgi:hypothetical protein